MIRIFLIEVSIILIIIEVSIGLNNLNLCKKSKSDYTCDGGEKYSYDCNPAKCTTNEEKCSQYKSLQFAVRTFKSHRQQEIDKFQDFEKKIKQCPIWQKSPLDNICINEAACPGNKSLFLALFTKMRRPKACVPMCSGKLTYTCGRNDVCALNKKECERFQKYLNENKKKAIHLKKCVN